MDTPRITMIAPFGIRPKGTLLARMLPLAKALTRDGMRVHIVAPPIHNPQDADTTVVIDGVTLTHTAVATLPSVLGVAQQVGSLVQAVRRSMPDIVYLFKPKGHAGLAARWLELTNPHIPMVVDCDDREGTGGWNDVLPYPRAARWLFDWQERTLPPRAAAVTVASRTLQSLCWADGCRADGVFYVPNAADVPPVAELPTQRNGQTMVLYTRFWEFDVAAFVPVLARICAVLPECRIDVIGTGEQGEERTFASLVAAAGIGPQVTMHGWLAPEAIGPVLAQASVALVPVRDTLINRARCSAKLLELLGAGITVVGHDVGEMRQFVDHGSNGVLVAPDDADGFADAVIGLFGDEARRTAMQGAAMLSARRECWDARVPACRAAFRSATQQTRDR